MPGIESGQDVTALMGDRSQWGPRADGSQKGNGFLGVLKRPDGSVSSEISIGVNIDGKEVEIPTLVPTLTQQERDWLLKNDVSDPSKIPPSIIQKAVDYARPRMAAGQSPFADSGPTGTAPKSGDDVTALMSPTFRSTNAVDASGHTTVDPRSVLQRAGDAVRDVETGVMKGVGNTIVGLGELVHQVPGVSRAVDALYGVPGISEKATAEGRRVLAPTNTAQKVGFYGEQLGEFFLPTGGASKGVTLAAEVGKSGLLTKAQGGSANEAGVSAAMTAVIPGAQAVRKTGEKIAEAAEPLVRAAIKPTVASLRKITGVGGMDAKANALVRFVIDHRLTTPDKARALFQETEHELQRVLTVRNAPTDAAARAERYLAALERSAAKQGLPADDVAQINRAAAELLEGPMGKDVVTMVPTPHPTLVGANGKPLIVMRPQTSRALRADVMADEALESARSSGKWTTRKAWGEVKGATTESAKAVERAQRDAVKAAVPQAKTLLKTEGQAIQAEQALDRMAQRAANRDAVSLPAHIVGAAELASGRVPFLAFAANWLRNNQMKAGIWADALGNAIQKGNAPMVADILKKLGVGATSQTMRTAPAAP